MNKLRTLLILLILVFVLHFTILIKIRMDTFLIKKNIPVPNFPPVKEIKKPAEIKGVGERLLYDVKLGKITLGKAEFSHAARVELNGKALHLMIFETKLPRFTDTEKIYTDPETLLPIRIERNILNLFSREKITEVYDHEQFTVTINKRVGSQKREETVIKRDSPIQNAILLPQYVRHQPELKIGDVFTANLPNRRYEIKLVSIEEIKVPAGTFKAYHFESKPKQIEIWISADERKIPIKIQSNATFGYMLVLREHNS